MATRQQIEQAQVRLLLHWNIFRTTTISSFQSFKVSEEPFVKDKKEKTYQLSTPQPLLPAQQSRLHSHAPDPIRK